MNFESIKNWIIIVTMLDITPTFLTWLNFLWKSRKKRKISDFHEYYDCGTNEVSNKFRTFLFGPNTFDTLWYILQAKHINISQMIFGFKSDVSSIRMEIAIGPKSDIFAMSRRTWNLRRRTDGSCRPLLHLTAVTTDRSVFRREKGLLYLMSAWSYCTTCCHYIVLLCKSVSLSVRLSITRHLRVATRPSCMTCKVSGRVQCTRSQCCIEYNSRSSHPAHSVCHIGGNIIHVIVTVSA